MVASVSDMPNQSLAPMQGESERAFVRRAHQSLMQTVPNPDQRNQIVWNAWDQSNGNPLRDRARGMFTQDIYRHVPSVAYFHEHSTIGRDGSPHVYGFDDLANIVDGQNQRADTDCYSAIASHHTSDLHKGPRFEPETVGYAGVYRLGMIGHTQPKWAVFADEFHKKDQADLFDKRRRRSVEVLRFKDGRPPVLDPIATLGADSPRLNLPVARYEQENAVVERYSFVAPAAVGATSSYVPKLDKYEQAPPQNPSVPNEGQGMLGPEDVQQIVTAMRSIPELAWVRQQMQTAVGGDGAGDDLSMGGGAPDAAGASPSAPTAPGAQPPMAPPEQPPQKMQQYGMGGMNAPMAPQARMQAMQKPNCAPQSYSNEEDDMVTTEQYTALQSNHQELAERYAQLSKANERLMNSQQEMRDAIVNLEQRAVDGERIQVISNLCEQYKSTGVFDRDELLETCLYSNGSEMNQVAFDNHIATMTKLADRVIKQSPVSLGMIPDGISMSQANEQERYEAVMDRFAEINDNAKERAAFVEKYGAVDYVLIEKSLIEAGKLHG
jgi:hypothetical protein